MIAQLNSLNLLMGCIAWVTLVPQAQAAELPQSFRDATICIYKTLKADSGIVSVDVYVEKRYSPIITFKFRTPKGILEATDISVDGPDTSGRFHYSGSIGGGNNPIDGMSQQIAENCHADGGFVDQVFIIDDPDRWRVDMSRYER